MDAIFGPTDEPELFHPSNGLLIWRGFEEMFERGIFTIVPDLPENPTKEAIDNWHQTEPKEYKFKLIDPNHPIADSYIVEIQKD